MYFLKTHVLDAFNTNTTYSHTTYPKIKNCAPRLRAGAVRALAEVQGRRGRAVPGHGCVAGGENLVSAVHFYLDFVIFRISGFQSLCHNFRKLQLMTENVSRLEWK